MDDINLRSNQIKNLISLAEEEGLTSPFSAADVDEILTSNDDSLQKLRRLGKLHTVIHEVLYTPPRK